MFAAVTIAALSSLPLGRLEAEDGAFADTYYVVAHQHYVLGLAAWFVMFGAVYAVIGRSRLSFRRGLARAHFGLFFFGELCLVLPPAMLGWFGMPRRYVDYPDVFTWINHVATVGYVLALAGLAVFLVGLGGAVWRATRSRRA